MEVRAYYATTIEAAIETARRELGSEAMLVQSRRSPAGTEHLGRYEVVFAGEIPELRSALHGAPDLRRLPADLDDVAHLKPLDLVSSQPDFLAVLRAADAATKPSRVRSVTLPQRVDPAEPVFAELSREIRCNPGLGRGGLNALGGTVALVGPSGSGKTSMLMKLAARYGVMVGRDLRIFSIDHLRMGAAETLRRFAKILHVDFEAFDSTQEFARAASSSFKGLTLIDTPGFSRGQTRELGDLAACVREHSAIETQLVLRVDRKTADNLVSLEQFAPFHAERLIVTALDETCEGKEARPILTRAQIPVSFLGVGPEVPEGVEAARSARLAELLWFGWRALNAA